MTVRNYVLLTVALLFATLCELKAQDDNDQPEIVSERAYDHKIIAILPLKTGSYRSGSTRKDSSVQQVIDKEEDWSLKAQEGLFNAITKDKEKLLVEVQDWRVTDSLLTKAGIDLRKVNFLDKQQLAAYLKVDALLAGQLVRVDVPNNGVTINNMTAGYQGASRQRVLSVLLYDGKTGNAIWSFDRKVAPFLFEKDKWLDDRLFEVFRRKFPYTR